MSHVTEFSFLSDEELITVVLTKQKCTGLELELVHRLQMARDREDAAMGSTKD